MDVDDSLNGYRLLTVDGKRFKYSVRELGKRPLRVAAVCLGLLCVLLLSVIIGQQVHYHKLERDQQNSYNAMTKERDNIQDNLKTMVKEKTEVQVNQARLQDSLNSLTKHKDHLQTNNNMLTKQIENLKITQTQLQSSNNVLTKERDQLKTSQGQLQTNNNALTNARDMLETRYKSVVQQRNQLQTSYNSVINDRDQLQNRYNNLTRSSEKLQVSCSSLVKDIEQLQDSQNFTATEKVSKETLESSHSNLTKERDILLASNKILEKTAELMQASYTSLIEERDRLAISCKNVTADRDWLKMRNNNLTTERDQLQREVERLNGLNKNKSCPPGWIKFQQSCYFTSTSSKPWTQSRKDCQNKEADLAIINSQEELIFISDLYASDKEVWIGLTDEGVEGHWKWVDGTTLTTEYWAAGQPNSFTGRNQDCVELWHRENGQAQWNDENCNVAQHWICEMQA